MNASSVAALPSTQRHTADGRDAKPERDRRERDTLRDLGVPTVPTRSRSGSASDAPASAARPDGLTESVRDE